MSLDRPPKGYDTYYNPEPSMSGCAIAFGVALTAFGIAFVITAFLLWAGLIP